LDQEVDFLHGLGARGIVQPREGVELLDVGGAHVGDDLVGEIEVALGKGALGEETREDPAKVAAYRGETGAPARAGLWVGGGDALETVVESGEGLEDLVGEHEALRGEDDAPGEVAFNS